MRGTGFTETYHGHTLLTDMREDPDYAAHSSHEATFSSRLLLARSKMHGTDKILYETAQKLGYNHESALAVAKLPVEERRAAIKATVPLDLAMMHIGAKYPMLTGTTNEKTIYYYQLEYPPPPPARTHHHPSHHIL